MEIVKQKHKVKIWDQISIVMKNTTLNTKEKIALIKRLKNIIIESDKNVPILNPEILHNIKNAIKQSYPDLVENVQLEITSAKQKWMSKINITLDEAIDLILVLLVASLNKHKFVSKTVLITHVAFYIINIIESKNVDPLSQIDYDRLNILFYDTINFDLHPTKLNLDSMSKFSVDLWKFVQFVTNLLIEQKLLEQSSSIAYRPSEFLDEYSLDEYQLMNWNKSRGTHGDKKPYPVIIINLSQFVKINSDEWNALFFSTWPQLEPESLEDITNDRQIKLRKGTSFILMKDNLKKYLWKMSNVKLSFNLILLKKIIANVDDKQFSEYKERSYLQSGLLLSKQGEKYKNNLYKTQNISRLQRIRSILDYFELTKDHATYRGWIMFVLEKKTKHLKKKRCKDQYNEIVKISSDLEQIPLPVFEKLISLYFNFLLCNYNIHSQLEEQKENLYIEFVKLIRSKLEFADDIIQFTNLMINIIRYLGFSNLTNFRYISELYPQKTINIFNIHDERVYSRCDINNAEKEILQENNELYKELIQRQINYNLNLNITFKIKLMEIYKNHKFYYSMKMAANGRLGLEGFAPHAHSGKFFRLCETEPQKLTPSGLLHLKRAVSFAFKNQFKTYKDHEKWVDTEFRFNWDYVEQKSCQRFESYIMVYHYMEALKGNPVGVFLRLDQVASGIALFGIINNCSYCKKISNVSLDRENIYQPYVCIAEDFIKPSLEKLKKLWDKKLNSDSSSQQKAIYSLLCEYILPNITQKKICKGFIMPHIYGLTDEGVRDKLIEISSQLAPEMRCSIFKNHYMFIQLSRYIYHALNNFSPTTTKVRRIMQSIEKIIISFIEEVVRPEKKGLGITVEYSNVFEHHDCTISWDYRTKTKLKRNIYNPKKGYSETKVFDVFGPNSCIKENTTTLPPLFMHSIDGAILRNCGLRCMDFDVEGIHDCQMAHPNHIDQLIINWKESICSVLANGTMTNKDYIEKIWLIPTLNNLKNCLNKDIHFKELNDIDNIKSLWDSKWTPNIIKIIDISEVRTSEYHFNYE